MSMFIEVTVGKTKQLVNLAHVVDIAPIKVGTGSQGTVITFSMPDYWYNVDESYDEVKLLISKAGGYRTNG